eukprot:750548-Karenia_brevis.AAC.1
MSLDCPDLQFPIKQRSRSMANPSKSSWMHLKKIARYLIGVERIVWRFELQDDSKIGRVSTDSDWGGNVVDRRSTSGGVWMIGERCIKTWSSTQGAHALSSAEA